MATAWQALRPSDELCRARNGEYDKLLKELVHKLKDADAKTLMKKDEQFPDVLDALDPSLDTLPYLFVLLAQVKVASGKSRTGQELLKPGGALWSRIATFVEYFNPIQVRYAGSEWRYLVELLATRARQAGQPVLSLQPILTAMLRLDPSGGCLTSTHLHYLRLCLEAGAFHEATPILDREIYAYPSTPVAGSSGILLCSESHYTRGFLNQQFGLTDKMNICDVHEYYLLGGMIYIGLKNWRRAIFYLDTVLAAPTNNGANILMLEAYKKRVFVSLMVYGKATSTPKTSNPNSMRLIKSAAKAYDGIADAFRVTDRRKLQAEMTVAEGILIEDGNKGLMTDVYNHHRRLFISNLAKTYATIPIKALAEKLGQLEDYTDTMLKQYIQEGSLNAKIESSPDGPNADFLRFADSASDGVADESDVKLKNQLAVQTGKIKELAEHVAEADRQLSLTKEYLDHTRKLRKHKDRNGAEDDAMDMYDMPGAVQDVDEDMMADDG